jgi:hypothetical protein
MIDTKSHDCLTQELESFIVTIELLPNNDHLSTMVIFLGSYYEEFVKSQQQTIRTIYNIHFLKSLKVFFSLTVFGMSKKEIQIKGKSNEKSKVRVLKKYMILFVAL